MIVRSLFIGLVTTSLLLALLALSRVLNIHEKEIVEFSPVEIITLESSTPPPKLSEPKEPEDTPPPPAPNIEFPNMIEDFDTPEMALSLTRIDLRTPIQSFNTSSAPAALPVIRRIVPKPSAPTKPTYKKPTIQKPAAKNSYYSSGELDGIPQTIRTGGFRWPSHAKGTTGKIKLLLEIDESGGVRVISVVSSTNSSLNTSAKRVAAGSRFTSPRKNGQKVKARFYKTYNLKKP